MTHRLDTTAHLFIELEQARLALMHIDATLAEARRAFHADGVALTQAALHALYGQQMAAVIAVQTLKVQAMQAKQTAKELKGKTFLDLLLLKMHAGGASHLVQAAQDESLQAVEAAGLMNAYTV